jgi:hypothetical protein
MFVVLGLVAVVVASLAVIAWEYMEARPATTWEQVQWDWYRLTGEFLHAPAMEGAE